MVVYVGHLLLFAGGLLSWKIYARDPQEYTLTIPMPSPPDRWLVPGPAFDPCFRLFGFNLEMSTYL